MCFCEFNQHYLKNYEHNISEEKKEKKKCITGDQQVCKNFREKEKGKMNQKCSYLHKKRGRSSGQSKKQISVSSKAWQRYHTLVVVSFRVLFNGVMAN